VGSSQAEVASGINADGTCADGTTNRFIKKTSTSRATPGALYGGIRLVAIGKRLS
jgi:hypothetical protein